MTNRARFKKVMNFEPVDHRPMIEWAEWWDKTIARWKSEGLPVDLADSFAIREYFGLDKYRQYWLNPHQPDFPAQENIFKGSLLTADGYAKLKPYLYPEPTFDRPTVQQWAQRQQQEELVVWITLEGFFWFPRTIFGIEGHLYAFYDRPELMKQINEDLLQFNLRTLDEFCQICVPDFMTFGEDMSYNNGPMISYPLFKEFLAPYYRKIVPRLKDYGIVPFIDTDGKIDELIPWLGEVGVEGFLPLEKQAGVDLLAIRQKYPRLKMIGGFDKMVMSQGEPAMRKEFTRLLPVMKQGGYIPAVDHQTPPDVSLDNYRIYLKLLQEYCKR